jgi:TRAP-type C4-dicarboxylate transport system substrate-binding protein
MKAITSVTTALLMTAIASVAGSAHAIEIRVSNPSSVEDSQMWKDTGKPFVEAVEERSGGDITFDVYHGGALIGGFGDQPQGIGSGLADAGALITSYNPSEFPMDIVGGAVHPWVERDTVRAVMMDRILFEEIPAFNDQYKNQNLERLFVIGATAFQLFSTRPVENLEDFKGLKLRVYGSYQPRVVEAAGGVPVTLSYGEILDGLHKGVIDATVINPINGRDLGFGDVAKHVTLMGPGLGVWLNAGIGFAMNADQWASLTAEQKRMMLEEARKVELAYAEDADSNALPKAIEDLKAAGLTIHELPASEKQKWGEQTPDFFKELAEELNGKGLPGDETIARFRELLEMPKDELTDLYNKVWDAKLESTS